MFHQILRRGHNHRLNTCVRHGGDLRRLFDAVIGTTATTAATAHHRRKKAAPATAPAATAKTDGRLRAATTARKNTGEFRRHVRRTGVFQSEHANLRLRFRAVVHGPDNFRQMPDVRLRVRDDDRITFFIRHHRGLRRNERRQIRNQLPRRYKADGNDLRHDFRVVRNLVRDVAALDRDVRRLRVIFVENCQCAPVANRRVAVLVQDGIKQIHRLVARHRVTADDADITIDARVQNDDETRRVAQIIQDHLQRCIAEI